MSTLALVARLFLIAMDNIRVQLDLSYLCRYAWRCCGQIETGSVELEASKAILRTVRSSRLRAMFLPIEVPIHLRPLSFVENE